MPLVTAIILSLGCFAAGLLTPLLFRKVRARLRSPGPNDSVTAPVDALHYARRTGQFTLFPAKGEIVCLGDSRIEHADWNEVLDGSRICNRGISGDTTSGIVERLEASIPETVKVCILQAGVNDVWRGVPLEMIRQNYTEIIRYIVEGKHAQLLVTAVVLVDKQRMALNAEIAKLNSTLCALCQEHSLHWLDLNETLAPSGYLEPSFTDDGTHFTGQGYRAIAMPLQNALARILAASRP